MREKTKNAVKTVATRIRTNFAMRMAGVKTEDGDHLLEVLGTIIIAVVVLIFFRSQIVNLFNDAIGKTTNEVNQLFNNVVPAGGNATP